MMTTNGNGHSPTSSNLHFTTLSPIRPIIHGYPNSSNLILATNPHHPTAFHPPNRLDHNSLIAQHQQELHSFPMITSPSSSVIVSLQNQRSSSSSSSINQHRQESKSINFDQHIMDRSESITSADDTIGSPEESTSAEKRPGRSARPNGSAKICRVCGDRAWVYNFNAITCESCKAFFRRNAMKNKKYHCRYGNNCEITVTSRKRCQKCRLRKCLEVGMKPEFIMTEEQRAQKRRRMMERESTEKTGSRKDAHGTNQSTDQSIKQRDETVASEPCSSGHPMVMEEPIDHQSMDQIDTSLQAHSDRITLSIPKSMLIGIMADRSSDEAARKIALGEVLMAAMRSASGSLEIDHRSIDCICPCACGRGPSRANRAIDDREQLATNDHVITNCAQSSAANDQSITGQVQSDQNQLALTTTTMNNTDPILTFLTTNSSTDQHSRPSSSLSSMFDTDILFSFIDAFGSRGLDQCDLESSPNTPVPSISLLCSSAVHHGALQSTAHRVWKLDELVTSSEEWKRHPMRVIPLKSISLEGFRFQDLFNVIYHSLRSVIKQTYRLTDFKALSLDDQQVLLRGTCRELFIMHAIMKYDSNTDQVQIYYPGQEYLSLELADRFRPGMHGEFRKLLSFFPENWRRDEQLMMILSAIALFNPQIPNLINWQAVEERREYYFRLLNEYLETAYGTFEAKQMMNFLNGFLNHLGPWVEKNALKMVFELEPRRMEPMMVEIFEVEGDV